MVRIGAKAMGRIMRRLESGERWWAAEIALRSFGFAWFISLRRTIRGRSNFWQR
jgi:hypothetical protein